MATTDQGHPYRSGKAPERCRFHVVLFDDPDVTLDAVKRLRSEGFHIADVHTPFPVHGMDQAMGLRETRLATVTLIGGLCGLAIAFWLMTYTHVFSWPLDIGGKSNPAMPAQVPILFELTVLLAAFGTFFGLLIRRRLYPRVEHRGRDAQPDLKVTDDQFAVVVAERDGGFSAPRFRQICSVLAPIDVREGWRTL